MEFCCCAKQLDRSVYWKENRPNISRTLWQNYYVKRDGEELSLGNDVREWRVACGRTQAEEPKRD